MNRRQRNYARKLAHTKRLGIESLEARIALSAEPYFTHAAGFFDSSFSLGLSADPGLEIRYTLDGSVPTASSDLYSSSISIDTTSTVRAAAFVGNAIDSNVSTSTYLFLADVLYQDGSGLPATWGSKGDTNYVFDPTLVTTYSETQLIADLKSLPTIALTVDPNDFLGLYEGNEPGLDQKYPVAVEMFDDQGVHFTVDAGILRKGNTSLTAAVGKANFRLYFDEDYDSDNDKLEYELFGPDAAQEFDKIGLKGGGGQDGWGHDNTGFSDPTYIRNAMVASIYNEIGGTAPHSSFAHAYINGHYWGLYQLEERPDEHFAEEYFGGGDDDYDFVNHDSTSEPAWQGLLDAIVLANDADDYSQITSLIDIPSFADYVISNIYSLNQDWWPNWTATKNTDGGLWQFHSWDGDRTFRGNFPQIGLNGLEGNPAYISNTLYSNFDEFKLDFADRAQKHLYGDGFLSADQPVNLWDDLSDSIEDAIRPESARWGDGRIPQADRTASNPWTTQSETDWQDSISNVSSTYLQTNGP